ncbi:hypothetical protein [Fodinicola acaciae]|uniref:hypothetical protein n=1 Tax=Fodinicola acaciae TaxID=2681555 RepID=UPI0013D07AD2|nr:hypothetical protein [Fodinicola acaciae]
MAYGPPPQKKTNVGLIIGIVAAVLVVFCCCACGVAGYLGWIPGLHVRTWFR